jgi:hypothetical protein
MTSAWLEKIHLKSGIQRANQGIPWYINKLMGSRKGAALFLLYCPSQYF